MNDNQKKVLIAAAAIVLAMLAFPPYWVEFRSGSSVIVDSGYDWIGRGNLDATTLLVQWVGVLIVSGIAWVVLKDR